MKKYQLGGGGILILLIICILLSESCKKNLNQPSQDLEVGVISNKNQQLIAALINGSTLSGSTSHTEISTPSSYSNNTTSATGTDYSVTIVNQMLKFDNSNSMLNFLAALDSTKANWDTEADPELQGEFLEKSISGDPTKNAFDAAMGFSSLRKNYEMAFYDNNNFKVSLPFEILEEDTRTVLNSKHEVQIGTTIYKFMGHNVIAEILNEDYTALEFLRDHPGLINNSPNLKLKNATTGIVLPETTPPPGPQGECSASVLYYFEENYQGDYRQVYLQIFPKAVKDGTTAYCSWQYNVNWGDGFSTPPFPGNLLPVLQHTYNTTLTAGQCKAFTISISVQATSCSIRDCQNIVGAALPFNVNICNALVGCGRNTNYKEAAPVEFVFGGVEYRIVGGVGAQHNTSLWPRRNMIYSRTFWQRKNNGSWYPTRNKKVYLTANVYGPIFKNSCTTISERNRSVTKRNQVHVEVNDNIGEDFGYTRVDPNIIKSDHAVFINTGSGLTVTITGHKLQ